MPTAGDKYYDLVLEAATKEPRKPIRIKVKGKNYVIPRPTRTVMRKIAALDAEATLLDDISEILLGDEHRDELLEYYETHYEEWAEIALVLRNHFFGEGTDDVEGKSPESSDSSNDSGTT